MEPRVGDVINGGTELSHSSDDTPDSTAKSGHDGGGRVASDAVEAHDKVALQ
jgi:hypothetical protein